MNRNICALSAALLTGAVAYAATDLPAPKITVVSDKNYGGSYSKLSDNGLWAVGSGKSQIAENADSYPRLYDLTNHQVINLFTDAEASRVPTMEANDVTDDGALVVGSYNGKPAVWTKAANAWQVVEHNHAYKAGSIDRVTPDGRYAIGTLYDGNGMLATVRLWDLSGGTARDITPDNLPKPIGPNLTPTTGTYDSMVQQLYAGDISDDGVYFSGIVNFSYPDDCWTFVYNMNDRTWTGVAMAVTEDGDNYTFERNVPGVMSVEPGNFVGSSHTMCGDIYSTSDNSGIYSYDCDSRQFSTVDESEGYTNGMLDPLGTIYGSKSYEDPMRDWYFKTGGYWFDFAVVAEQLWGIDWKEQYAPDNLGLTGTFTGVADDGKTVVAVDFSMSPYTTYMIQLPEPLPEIVKDFNMLGNYYTTPVNNSSFAMLREVKVTFDREVEVVADFNAVKLLDENGNVVANSISLQSDPGNARTLTALFRNRRLDEGKSYKVVFPAGVVSLVGNRDRVNAEISVSYKGRPNAPVAPVAISPADGSEVSRINATSNPVSLRFNSEIANVGDDAPKMRLYLLDDEGKREEVAVLGGSITGDVLSVYPMLEQRLAYGSKYQIVIPAGVVSDLSGADPNEEIVVNYVGAYVPEGPGSDGVLFEDNFDQGLTNKWMYYDGASDNEPSTLMQSWGFEQGMPWWTVMDNEMATSQSAASHSMFKSPGQADAWMVTSLVNIKDDSAYLSFKSQSYRDVGDHLKVYVYVTDDIYTMLTPSIVDNFRYYGDLVFDEVQYPGKDEELLEGDWVENSISLAKYAGKNIYVAFVNDNRNKSAVFLDDVRLAVEMKFNVLNLTPATVVDKTEIAVEGMIQVVDPNASYNGYSIVLSDADGNKISELADADAVAVNGWKLNFTMPQNLPLTVGKENKYSIAVTLGDKTEVVNASVGDLALQTSKKVVIEEMTGQGCQYCPLGHAAVEWIQKDFPGLVLPIELHTYTGDNLNNEKVQDLCNSLGLQSAPTARVNRKAGSLSPMDLDENGNYVYKNANVWYDHVVSELENMAPADVEVTSVVFDGTNCVADVKVTYALDIEKANANLLLELCEDDIMGFQTNSRYDLDQPALGEWGKGGIYGKPTVLYYYHNVLRNWEGTTFNGTGGLLPDMIEAGVPYEVKMKVAAPKSISDIKKTHVTAMLIDSESGRVLNADRRFTDDEVSVDQIDSQFYSMTVDGRNINIAYPGDLEVQVYSLDGVRIASASGSDAVSLDVEAGNSIALVVVRTADGLRHHKVRLN